MAASQSCCRLGVGGSSFLLDRKRVQHSVQSAFPLCQRRSNPVHTNVCRKRTNQKHCAVVASAASQDSAAKEAATNPPATLSRRALGSVAIAATLWVAAPSQARERRQPKVDEAEYSTNGDGLKYYDFNPGKGPEAAKGKKVVAEENGDKWRQWRNGDKDRVAGVCRELRKRKSLKGWRNAKMESEGRQGEYVSGQVHFDCVYKTLTVVSSRSSKLLGGNRVIAQPYELVVGSKPGSERKRDFVDNANGLFSAQAAPKPPPALYTIVEGMRVGGKRTVIVPPEFGYGQKGIGEIPPGATFDLNIELLEVDDVQKSA